MNSDQVEYDTVFIGTGLISVLEALYQEKCGKKILMIEQSADLGGAWQPLTLFGFTDVENAIHYFLPDERGLRFMRENLKWDVEKSKGKFKIFYPPVFGLSQIKYDHPWADFLEVYSAWPGYRALFTSLKKTLVNLMAGKKRSSNYVRGGAAEMMKKTKSMVAKSNIEFKFSSVIEEIRFNSGENELVQLKVKHGDAENLILTKMINISHGAKIKKVGTPTEVFSLNEKTYSRPAAHLLVTDETETRVFESIFSNHSLIKYAHDVTRFAVALENGKANQKIFVLALQHNVRPYEGLFQDLFSVLKKVRIIGPDSKLEGHFWWDVYLPSIDDETLNRLTQSFGNNVSILKTENFAKGIGLCADRWATKIN